MDRCRGCGRFASEVCSGEYCKPCHEHPGSAGWEECINDTWADGLRRRYGLPTSEDRKAEVPG